MKHLEGKVIALASDHAGFSKKQVIKKYFEANGIAYEDLGSYTEEEVLITRFTRIKWAKP